MSRTVSVEDGGNAYTLTRNDDDNSAALTVKGKLTAKLARELINDLTPLTAVKKRSAPAAKDKAPAATAKREGTPPS